MRRLISPATIAGAGVFVSTLATASDIENITVTASRTPTALTDVGSAITVISGDEIRRRAATNLADLLRDVPGFAIGRQGSVGTLGQVRVRGAEANQVLVLIDGIEANDISQGDEFNFTHVPTSGIRRVEIVRGPQSALWGSDALSGVINIITEPPRAAENRLRVGAEFGSFGTTRATVDAAHGSDDLQLSLGVSRADTDGTNIARSGTEKDGYENTTVRFGVRMRLTDNLELGVSARNTDAVTDFDGVDFASTGLPVDAPYRTDARQTYGKLTLVAESSDRIDHRLTIARTDTRNINDTGTPIKDVSMGIEDTLHWQTNLRFGAQTLSLVAEHEREDYEQRGESTPFGDPNKRLATRTDSVAVEFRHDSEPMNFSISARHDDNSEFDDSTTWRITNLWQVTDATGLFASIGEGSKDPTFTERFGFFDTFVGNPGLKPERSRSWEFGVREHFAFADLTLSASYFRARLEDEINGFVFDAGAGAFTAENVDGESDRQGIEAEFSWRASPSFSLQGSYTWLDATQTNAGVETDEIRRPRNKATLRADYQWNARGNVNVGIIYSGTSQDDYFPPVPPFQARVELPDYTLVDLATRYRLNDRIMLTARIENLLDETYEEVYGFRAPGFAAYAGVEWSL